MLVEHEIACESQASLLEVAVIFYEFTGTITYRFLTNQKACCIQVAFNIIIVELNKYKLPFLY